MKDSSQGASESIARLRGLVFSVPGFLAESSASQASIKANPDRWSMKEELGHLIDSAENNHRRFVLGQIEDHPHLPTYDGEAWVAIHRYQEMDWFELIELWQAANLLLLRTAEAAPDAAWDRTVTLAELGEVTLRFILADYLTHAISHLAVLGLDPELLGGQPVPCTERPAPTEHYVMSSLRRRWSPVTFAEKRPVERDKILMLLEAARWAPSCFNEQPWRYLVFDHGDPAALEQARQCLVEGNAWARKAPVLILSVAYNLFTHNSQPNRWAQHDTGMASENLVVSATQAGLVAHQMAGYDADRARKEFNIAEDFTPIAMMAIGYPYSGDPEAISEKLRTRESQPRSRRPISDFAYAGTWGSAL